MYFSFRFYDGVCQWEEGSHTNILHIGWAKPLVTTIGRFDAEIRSQVIINCGRDDEDVSKQTEGESNNNIASDTIDKTDDKSTTDTVISTLEALTAACGEKILNPDFLLQGGGQPFAEQQQIDVKPAVDEKSVSVKEEIDAKAGETSDQNKPKEKDTSTEISAPVYEPPEDLILPKRPTITLYSRKMKGIKDLLLAEKLNTQAISLQVTAQSQTQVGGKKGRSSTVSGSVNSAKRSRRQ